MLVDAIALTHAFNIDSSRFGGTVKVLNRRNEFQSPGRNGHRSGKNVADYAFCATSVTLFRRENA